MRLGSGLRQDLEAAAVDRSEDAEVPPIEGYDGSSLISGGEDDNRRVGKPDRLIGLALDDRVCQREVLRTEACQIPGAACQLAQHCQLG
jgi:hypothetical protein